MRIALKAIATTKGLCILESRDDEVESVVGGPPAVCVVSQGHEVGPGDDEAIAAHRAGLGVTQDVSLQTIDKLSSLRSTDLIYYLKLGKS